MGKEKATEWFTTFRQDFAASIVVFFVALPLCLGIALASGAPLFAGLIAGIIGGIVVGSISGSALGVSGPAAGLAVIVLQAISDLGGYQVFLAAVIIGGLIQLMLAVFRAGIIGYYFPSAVIKGMLSGIGIIIVLKQIPHAFGYDLDYPGDLNFNQLNGENTFSELANMLDYLSPPAILVSFVSLSILIVWEAYLMKKAKFFNLLQGPIVAVLFGIAYQLVCLRFWPSWAISEGHLVSVPVAKNMESFLGQFMLPDFSAFLNPEVYWVGITVAIVASLETLLSVEATDKLDPHKRITPTTRELYAQGIGNVLSGFIGGLPITQVVVRSSANIQSNGKTKLSAIIHGFLILFSVILIPRILNLIPLAVLACVLFMVGYKLAKPSLFSKMYHLGAKQFIPFIVTIIGIIFTDLLLGISLGFAASILVILRENFMNSYYLKEKKVDDGANRITLKLAEEVSFLNKAAILDELNQIESGTFVVIDMSESVRVDYDVLEIISNFSQKTAKEKDIEVEIKKGKIKIDQASF